MMPYMKTRQPHRFPPSSARGRSRMTERGLCEVMVSRIADAYQLTKKIPSFLEQNIAQILFWVPKAFPSFAHDRFPTNQLEQQSPSSGQRDKHRAYQSTQPQGVSPNKLLGKLSTTAHLHSWYSHEYSSASMCTATPGAAQKNSFINQNNADKNDPEINYATIAKENNNQPHVWGLLEGATKSLRTRKFCQQEIFPSELHNPHLPDKPTNLQSNRNVS